MDQDPHLTEETNMILTQQRPIWVLSDCEDMTYVTIAQGVRDQGRMPDLIGTFNVHDDEQMELVESQPYRRKS